jgi:serine/threonine-protein kinase
LVHRDVKPANILIDRRGAVKLLDLGIARLPGDEAQAQGDGSEIILGTIDYLAPEQAVDSVAVDARADIYALGATLYFLIAGHPPFPGPNLRHKLAAKQYCDPPPVHRLRPDVEPGLAAVIQKLLKRDPAERYPSAAAAAAALAPFAQLTSNFPARLFQPKRPTTVHEERITREAESPLPATQRIIRPDSLPSPTDLPTPQSDDHPTAELRKAPTDLAMTPIPDGLLEKLATPAAETPAVAPPGDGSRWLWIVGVLCLVAIAAAILVSLT